MLFAQPHPDPMRPMERCLEVFVARTHKTRISGQQALNDPRVAVRNGLEDRGCVIHGGSRQNSLIIDRHGAAPLISLHDPPAKGVPDQHWLLDGEDHVAQNGRAAGSRDREEVRSGPTVTRWDVHGRLIGTVQLIGFGSVGKESAYPQNRGIAAHGPHWFTYSDG